MTYTCPFCKKAMQHFINNSEQTKSDRNTIAHHGDTFKCDCKNGNHYNSWRFDSGYWEFLDSQFNWLRKTKEGEIPYFEFNPSSRR